MVMRKILQLLVVLSCLVLPVAGLATSAIDVTSHTAQYLDRMLQVVVQWESRHPVVKVRVTAGREAREIKVDEYDNRRIATRYAGEVTALVPVEPLLYQKVVPYVIQLEDELRQRSAVVTGNAALPAMGLPDYDHGDGRDGWRQDYLKPTSKSQGGAGDIIDKLTEIKDRHDIAPSIDVPKPVINGTNVVFTSRASDDRGINKIVFKVFDAQGSLVKEEQLSGLGKSWQGSSPVFNLPQHGNYRVTAQAFDTTGNSSKEQSAQFVVGTPPGPVQPVQHCVAGTVLCGTICVDLRTSQQNCGICGTVCPAGFHCQDGRCVQTVTCSGGTLKCGDACSNPRTDSKNCGACGVICPAGKSCVNGVCTMVVTEPVCPTSKTSCSGACVDTKADVKNCGNCGTSCPVGQSCMNGVCTANIVPPSVTVGCGVKVTDIIPGHHGSNGVFFTNTVQLIIPQGFSKVIASSNPDGIQPWGADDWANVTVTSSNGTKQNASIGKNNGSGHPMGEQYVLSNVITFQPGLNTVKVDLWNEFDPPGGNQGSSAMWLVVFCADGQACKDGQCGGGNTVVCPVGKINCDGSCVDIKTDANNCGGCSKNCLAGQRCVDGTCTLPVIAAPPAPPVICPSCPSGTHCNISNGVASCVSDCAKGELKCGSSCVNTLNDIKHCGGCSKACPTDQSCVNGICTVVCPVGKTNCSGSCIDTKNDAKNCGSCGNICPTGKSCSGGVCTVQCPVGKSYCNGSCVDTATDAGNCGNCGNICASGQGCQNGVCCKHHERNCNGICSDVWSDAKNCGSCGNVCPVNHICKDKVCVLVCPTGLKKCTERVAGENHSKDVCVDTNTDPKHCGWCSSVCTPNSGCKEGCCTDNYNNCTCYNHGRASYPKTTRPAHCPDHFMGPMTSWWGGWYDAKNGNSNYLEGSAFNPDRCGWCGKQ